VAAEPAPMGFLSNVFEDHMVLQRGPKSSKVWGTTSPGASVTAELRGAALHQYVDATVDETGLWVVELPPVEASMDAFTLTLKSSSGETAKIRDVLFGDVYICGGQSNMQFSLESNANSTAEIKRADGYGHLRLFTVGQGSKSALPLDSLQTVEQHWTVSNSSTVHGNGGMGYFSSVCWFFGVEISDALGGTVPLGLISDNWGGTKVEKWATSAAFEACGRSPEKDDTSLYNAMINPFTIGPMALTGFTWYQGEANTGDQASADDYACLFPAMIEAWRFAFEDVFLYFGFVQLSTWCAEGVPLLREAQMSALKLKRVGYATNADHGAGCNIHPPPKQFCAKRLAKSALAIVYGHSTPRRSPNYVSANATVENGIARATVTLRDVGDESLRTDVLPANYLYDAIKGNFSFDCDANAGVCAWASLTLEDGSVLNATVTAHGGALLLEAACAQAGARVVSTSYAFGAVPMMNAYSESGLPVLPWSAKLE